MGVDAKTCADSIKRARKAVRGDKGEAVALGPLFSQVRRRPEACAPVDSRPARSSAVLPAVCKQGRVRARERSRAEDVANGSFRRYLYTNHCNNWSAPAAETFASQNGNCSCMSASWHLVIGPRLGHRAGHQAGALSTACSWSGKHAPLPARQEYLVSGLLVPRTEQGARSPCGRSLSGRTSALGPDELRSRLRTYASSKQRARSHPRRR